jgi:hypothetical protein
MSHLLGVVFGVLVVCRAFGCLREEVQCTTIGYAQLAEFFIEMGPGFA